jgi:hypothetical protein
LGQHVVESKWQASTASAYGAVASMTLVITECRRVLPSNHDCRASS